MQSPATPALGDGESDLPMHYNATIAPDLVEGHYADMTSVWQSGRTFVLDFLLVTHPMHLATDDDGNESAVVDCQVVTRVRMAPGQIHAVMKRLEELAQDIDEREFLPTVQYVN